MRPRKLLFTMFSLFVLASMVLAACAPAPTEAPAPVATEPPTVATEPPAAATEPPAATEAPADDPIAELYEAPKAEGMLTTIALPRHWCNYTSNNLAQELEALQFPSHPIPVYG